MRRSDFSDIVPEWDDGAFELDNEPPLTQELWEKIGGEGPVIEGDNYTPGDIWAILPTGLVISIDKSGVECGRTERQFLALDATTLARLAVALAEESYRQGHRNGFDTAVRRLLKAVKAMEQEGESAK